MTMRVPNCPDCGQHALRVLAGHLYHCEKCRYTMASPAAATAAE